MKPSLDPPGEKPFRPVRIIRTLANYLHCGVSHKTLALVWLNERAHEAWRKKWAEQGRSD